VKLTLVCENCGSTDVHSNETLVATAFVTYWTLEGDKYVPEYSGESDVCWDSQAVDEEHPFFCRECCNSLTAGDVRHIPYED
jgi:hypothetical protein